VEGLVQERPIATLLWTGSLAFLLTWGGESIAAAAETYAHPVAPPGEEKNTKTKVLETSAAMLQTNAPLKGMDVYLVGFHPMKDDPTHQMEAHHFCHQINEDFAQCALFDGNTKEANLNGIEYIISEKLFNSLPAEEKQYWHPHNYEILSGQLVAPGIPNVAEKALMKGKMNSYGKTWHVWNTGGPGQSADQLPLGKPMLAWSFNHDGEAKPGLVEQRDKALDLNTSKLRKERQDLVTLAKPQTGVDVLQGKFPGSTQAMPEIKDTETSVKEQTKAP
jgi:hypothetical protein